MANVEAILADVGGVTIKNYEITGDIRQRLCFSGDNRRLDPTVFDAMWPDLIAQYGSGMFDETELWEQFCKAGAPPVSIDEQILSSTFEANLTPHEKTLKLLRGFGRAGGALAVLSNTNANHTFVLREHGIYDGFDAGVFLSHEIHARKPGIGAYETTVEALAKQGINPKNTLFIDDKSANLPPAEYVGMQTLHMPGNDAGNVAALATYLNS